MICISICWVFLLNVFCSALFLKGKNLKISEPVFDPEGGGGSAICHDQLRGFRVREARKGEHTDIKTNFGRKWTKANNMQ